MDSLGKTLNNLSLYEVKAYVRKAQNAVLNLSEMEAKVREATNNEPWGTPTSVMSEIARGTFSYPEREEICAMIFRRFTEKSAHEWRQIYKALQLMEYLVKHGSERFVDDARANVNLVSMLKSFHYIDSKGVDQGINVRNRARELSALLNDESKIRQERRKAKENAKKFGAVSSNSTYMGSSSLRRANAVSSSYDYDEEDAGYAGRVFGDGGVFGQRFEEQAPTNASKKFEEYDVEDHAKPKRTSKPSVQASSVTASAQPNVDLFSFDDKPAATSTAGPVYDEEEEFDEFQSASTPAQVVQPHNNLTDLLNASYGQQASNPAASFFQSPVAKPFSPPPSNQVEPAISHPKKKEDIFGSLLTSAKTKTHSQPSTSTTAKTSPTPATPANHSIGNGPGPVSSTSKEEVTSQSSSSGQGNGVVDLLSF
ncbi:hypothetical protein KL905_002354 [Ogataea polymorpha]|uniref:ENTH domain-containing protein n=2 Tax=Ogataea polymorpha TaxID=460523 RepID=A0A9P8PRA7_9ASCO|nr:hypothetical protein KL937_001624 [Ogataea polymorpha]KAG7890076.1 hypothetical protein KL936_002750 [Ogataea polymorpha]KAG7893518.1 hypothetical protein KL908_002572 [Ogataea polymorpha]KAG7901140.1 hypothetical protein KL935_002206 [Ogataea polymorpha]KAG7905493.1 hypothetical protein KL907_002640 [Ogataea polymorpha]